jgi:hypothetical protein
MSRDTLSDVLRAVRAFSRVQACRRTLARRLAPSESRDHPLVLPYGATAGAGFRGTPNRR